MGEQREKERRRATRATSSLIKDDGASTFSGTTGHNSAKLYLFQPHFASRLAKEVPTRYLWFKSLVSGLAFCFAAAGTIGRAASHACQ